jgi:hypothetical protein
MTIRQQPEQPSSSATDATCRVPRRKRTYAIVGGMHSRPPAYYYGQVYLGAFLALCCLVAGIQSSDWEFFAFALALSGMTILGLAYLDWWRQRYDEWNPNEPDHETSRLNRATSSFATRVLVRVFRRRP